MPGRAFPSRRPRTPSTGSGPGAFCSKAVSKLKTALLAEGKEVYYTVFAEFWNDRPIEEDSQKSSYGQIARKYSITESDVGNYLRVVRERLRTILKGIVTGYLGPGENVEDEVRFILSR
jgi:hypothetical protein